MTDIIQKFVDSLDPTHQLWLKNYLNQKLQPTTVQEVVAKEVVAKEVTNNEQQIYIFDYRYADAFPNLTPEQVNQLKSIGAELMFIYDTIHHDPIRLRNVGVTLEAYKLVKNTIFWGDLCKGYNTCYTKEDPRWNGVIGPASAGLILCAPPNSEYKIFSILETIDDSLQSIDNVEHLTFGNQKVVHVKVDAEG